ncbi:hypothetical protein SO694_00005672 [Aureococcus anophagefferens]|uniref:J domain-containing protein n=1 Tax=Aureococcus anophagefferens TaxID=44056 RepID=A0ABR1G9Y9_AURAN
MGLLERSQSVLGLSPLSSDGDVRKSFRRLSLEHHPDRNPDDVDGATKRFQAISSAYAYLTSEAGSAEAGRAAEPRARRAAERCDFAERRRKPGRVGARRTCRPAASGGADLLRRGAQGPAQRRRPARALPARGLRSRGRGARRPHKRRPLDPLPGREARDAAADAAEQDARAAAVRRSAFEAARLRKARQALDDRRHAEAQRRLSEAAMREAGREAREAEEAERAAREAHERAEAEEAEARDRRFAAPRRGRETRDAPGGGAQARGAGGAARGDAGRRERLRLKEEARLESERARDEAARAAAAAFVERERGREAAAKRWRARGQSELEHLKGVARAKLEAMDAQRREAVAMANEDEIARACARARDRRDSDARGARARAARRGGSARARRRCRRGRRRGCGGP